MSVNLEKGQVISLGEMPECGISSIKIGLGWRPKKKKVGWLSY